jgi:lipoprotein-anchoring transpeptidase ErfK/SrfK
MHRWVLIRRSLIVLALLACAVDKFGARLVGASRFDPPVAVVAQAVPHRVPETTLPPADFGSGPVTSLFPPTVAPIARSTSWPEPSLPPVSSTAPPPPAPAVTALLPTTTTSPPPTSAPPPAIVARVTAPRLEVFTDEGAPSAAFALPATTEFGHPRVLLTKQLRGDWVQVYLPLRPNGQLGWVRSRDVALTPIVDEVDVDLARSTLTWTRAGQVVLSVASAVGAPSTPTPRGTFFVTDVLPQSNPSGAYGAWIIALDAHSEALATFEGGDPRIAIHGTNDPSSIGHAVSNGCMRVDAGPLDALRAALLPGTPVVVH